MLNYVARYSRAQDKVTIISFSPKSTVEECHHRRWSKMQMRAMKRSNNYINIIIILLKCGLLEHFAFHTVHQHKLRQ